MESIGNLAGGIAHDFNNLLTAILGYSSVLLDDMPADLVSPQARPLLQEIRTAGERASTLTAQLLAFSRRQIVQPRTINVNTVVTGVETMLRRLIGEDVQLSTRLARNLGSAVADIGQLEQVIMNLVVNARDAMPNGGQVTVETANIDLDEAYARSHMLVTPGPYVMLAVADTGSGMSAETQARAFEPFFTTKPQGRGTGLGLATVYGIVKQAGGNIWIYSELEKGTTFKIYLPRVNQEPDPVTTSSPAATLTGSETVLLVEDDEGVRRLAHNILERNGYTVIVASGPDEALDIATSHPDAIHLLLTDVVMPGSSGRMLAQRLTQQRPALKVLYMSGYTDNAIVHHGVLMHGVAFLQKPFTPVTFTRAVRQVLDAPAHD